MTLNLAGPTSTQLPHRESRLTVTGHFNTALNPAQVEQRIVNPALTDTDVARRDIRAVPGGPTPAPKGGYTSDLVYRR